MGAAYLKMPTVLFIAGHGWNKDGSFDPGAGEPYGPGGGEWKYHTNMLFPAMKKYIPKGAKVVFHTKYNVYSYDNLAGLAKYYGPDTIVIECHYDAYVKEARGGHVIVHKDYEPDKYDLAIRDVIAKHIGVRYNHKGHKGISGRDELKNCNIARNNNVNYRLWELGFGTNPQDSKIMTSKVDAIAKDLVKGIFGEVKEPAKKPAPAKPVSGGVHVVKSGDTLWDIANANKTTVKALKEYNNLKGDLITPGQKIVTKKPKPVAKTYTVKSGDNLSEIGEKLNVPWKTIADKNGIKSPYIIHVGDKLKY